MNKNWIFLREYENSIFSKSIILSNIDEVKRQFNLKKEPYGFIYCITYKNKTFYIGKKNFYKYKEVPAKVKVKNGIVIKDNYKKIYKHKLTDFKTVRLQNDWKIYNGSTKIGKVEDIENKVMINIAYSKLHLTFLENQYLYNNLLKDNCINEQISNKIYKQRLLEEINGL